MLRKTEKYYIKRIKTYKSSLSKFDEYGSQNIKRTTYWLFYIIPIFIKCEIIKGDYEYRR